MAEQRYQAYYPPGAPCGGQTMGPVDVEDLANFFTSGVGRAQQNVPTYYPNNTIEEAAFDYCTDSRWMACPATSYCPLYDVRPLQSWQALPCAQDFYGYYMHQPQDEELVEEFLCVVEINHLLLIIWRVWLKICDHYRDRLLIGITFFNSTVRSMLI